MACEERDLHAFFGIKVRAFYVERVIYRINLDNQYEYQD